MTLQELSKYYDIQMTLEKDREALERLRQRITPASPQLTGMPHTPGVRDKVGDLAVELADMDERIRWLEELAAQEKPKVEATARALWMLGCIWFSDCGLSAATHGPKLPEFWEKDIPKMGSAGWHTTTSTKTDR